MLTVETWPVDRLIPYARNPRKNDAAVEQMCGAIQEFGFRIPIVARSDGTVVDGHLRLKAAQRLGLEDVPVALADDLTEAQIKAFRLLANRSASWAAWDDELLALEFQDLRDLGFDLGLTGFDPGEIAGFLADPMVGLTDPDDVPAVPEHPVSRPGDVWLLGSHRLVCGDCTDPATVERVLAGVTPHLMVTDPPYGVEYDPTWRNRAGVSTSARTGAVLNDHRADWREAWALFPGDVAYVWHGALHAATVADSLTACGFAIRAQIVWAKERLVMSRGHYHWQHEPAWYAVRGTGHWTGDRKQTTLWSIPSRDQDAATIHGTQKPTECMRRPMLNNSSPGQAVYEPFSGSGTTIIAAETTGRVCHAIEISPAYVDVAILRWQAFTGKEALLDGTDRTFAATAGERAANTEQDTASAEQAAVALPCQQETSHGRTA
jgi:DNA modification methylase